MPSSNVNNAPATADAPAKKLSWIARHRNGSLYSFVAVLIAAAVCGTAMSTAYFYGQWGSTAFAGADARLDEAQGGAQRALLFPEAASFTEVTAPSIEGLNSVYTTDSGDYVFDVSSAGSAGDVEVLVGIASDGTVAQASTTLMASRNR